MQSKKVAFFDIDGVINHGKRFSERYSQFKNIDIEVMLPFFKNEFSLCLVGKADLKEELEKVLDVWKWDDSVESLLNFWFEGEVDVDQRMINKVMALEDLDVMRIGATNQEKYRTEYIKNEMDLDKIFDRFYSSAEIGVKKPNKDFYRYILNDLDAGVDDVVYWDDDKENVEAATEFGITSYLFREYEEFLEQYEEHIKN